MASKFVQFILPIAALTPLVISSLPAGAQTSGAKMQNQHPQGAMNHNNATTPKQSSAPASLSPSNSTNNNNLLSSYLPQKAPILKIGSKGKAVKDIQAFLKKQNIYKGQVDGVYGQSTRLAVAAFQRSHKLTADGVVGRTTWSSMINSHVS